MVGHLFESENSGLMLMAVYRVSRADGYSGLDVAFSVQGMPIMLGYVVSVDFVLGMSYSCLLQ